MQTITYDIETFWSTDFSLSKISFMEYIMSPEAEVISVAVKINDEDTVVKVGHEVEPYLKSLDWANSAAIAHNGNEFDHPLLVWKYDVHPKMFIDTLCMARPFHQSSVGGSLAKLSKEYGLQDKNNAVLLSTKGKRLMDFTAHEIAEMRIYNKGDTDNTYELFRRFRAKYVEHVGDDVRDLSKALRSWKKELAISDMTARMIVYPQLYCDMDLLENTLVEAEDLKRKQLEGIRDKLGLLDVEEARSQLASSKMFGEMLTERGVDIPMKISKTTGKPTYALAKTDEEFTALLEHPDEEVAALVSARLGVKSTLLETRLATMHKCATVMGGRMPVPLAYHSATTGRWGGRVWNPQNLPRIPRDKAGNPIPKLTNALRDSLIAPPGHLVVVSDLSGIELRVNHYLWKVDSTAKLYAADPEADLYKEFASALFGKDKADITKDERQLAKVAQLGLGYGAGWRTFKKVAKLMGGIDLSDEEAERVTLAWRTKYRDIVNGWTSCQAAIVAMYRGSSMSPDPRGLCTTFQNGITLPSGRSLYYPALRLENDEVGKQQFVYGEGKNKSKVYSGLMDENLVQAISRDVIAEQALVVANMTGHYPAHMVHDELVYVIAEQDAHEHLAIVDRVMRTPPKWLPGIVLHSEGDVAPTYGAAK
jgi:DNA polymerase